MKIKAFALSSIFCVVCQVMCATTPVLAKEFHKVVKPKALAKVNLPVEKVVFDSSATDDYTLVLIDNTTILANFDYDGHSRPIWKSKQFMTSAATDYSQSMFYVAPLVLVDVEKLKQANINKTPTGSGASNVYTMTFPITLSDNGLKQKAADRIQALNHGNVFTGNISSIPYKRLIISIKSENNAAVPLSEFPDASIPSNYIVTSYPDTLSVTVKGSAENLAYIAAHPERISAVFTVSGFKIKQNILNLSLKNLVSSEYFKVLTGQADWSYIHSISSSNSAVHSGVDLTSVGIPLSFGTIDSEHRDSGHYNFKGYLTRNQLRQISEKSIQSIDVANWQEYKSDRNLDALQSDLLTKMTDRAKRLDVRIRKVGNEWKLDDDAMRKDMSSTTLGHMDDEINTRVEAKNTHKKDKSGDDNSMITSSDINWATDGHAEIPKSLKIYVSDISSYADVASYNFTETLANSHVLNQLVQGVTRHWTENVPVKVQVSTVETKKIETFVDHFNGLEYVVGNVDINNSELKGAGGQNRVYQNWCTLFNPTDYLSVGERTVAVENEQIKLQPASLGLPPINARWPQILDNEYWYIRDVQVPGVKEEIIQKSTDIYQ